MIIDATTGGDAAARATRLGTALSELGGLDGDVVLPTAPSWDEARRPWQLAVDQRPVAVVRAASTADVTRTVRAAAAAGLRVAPQASGHHARLLAPLDDTVLLRTGALCDVVVDPRSRTARVGSGTPWGALTDAAARWGLAGLAGSSRDVGVVGYHLGGGLSWLARSHGLAASHVIAAEVVTADGVIREVDARHEPELFWALRGGGGSFAVVTALHVQLFPIAEVEAGTLYWPIERAAEVLHTWRRWTAVAPEEMTTFGRLLRLPSIPFVPPELRGRSLVAVGVVSQLDAAATDTELASLRALGPEIDTVTTTPVGDLGLLHMDPPGPTADTGDGLQVRELPAEALEALLAAAGPGSGSSLLSTELRHLGGAASPGRAFNGGALDGLDAAFALFAVTPTPNVAATVSADADLDAVHRAMEPWTAATYYPNFCERWRPPEAVHDPTTLARLRRVKDRWDPDNLLRANHPVR